MNETKNILLTGANGYLGNVILDKLEKSGHRLVCVQSPFDSEIKDNFVQADLIQQNDLKKLDEHGPFDAVVHCAAMLPGTMSEEELYYANQKMTLNLANWAGEQQVDHFVFASSCSVYGYGNKEKNEKSVPEPSNLYAVSKLACENILQSQLVAQHIKTAILRISAPYGPGMRMNTVIKIFLEKAAAGEPLILMGDGQRRQDFIFERDIASAFDLAVRYKAHGIFNLSSGKAASMKNLARTVAKLFKHDFSCIQFHGTDLQENYRGLFPNKAARKSFAFTPQYDLQDGLRLTAKSWGLL